jgi:hypothetical protein
MFGVVGWSDAWSKQEAGFGRGQYVVMSDRPMRN